MIETECENVVIGSGAGGSTTADFLISQNREVVILEEGDWPQRSSEGGTRYPQSTIESIRELYRYGGIQPIYGFPTVAFGEGKCVGGSTEINGGLFWRTPQQIIEIWDRDYGLKLSANKDLENIFENLERRLGLIHGDQSKSIKSNQASILLKSVAKELNWLNSIAPRVAPGCKNRNRCAAGCLEGHKNSMSTTFLKDSIAQGLKIITNAKALGIQEMSQNRFIVNFLHDGVQRQIKCRRVFVCAGALHSPLILKRSGYLRQQETQIGLHLNLKFIVKFNYDIEAWNGTIFTHQIQEFMEQGMLIMSSNFDFNFLSLALNGIDRSTRNSYMNAIQKLAIFTVQIRPKNYGRIYFLKGRSIPTFNLTNDDLNLLKRSAEIFLNAMFDSKVVESMVTPFSPASINSFVEGQNAIHQSKKSDWSISSVHAMSSLPVNGEGAGRLVQRYGNLSHKENIIVADASILPTTLGESPQETIMALVRLNLEKKFENEF